MQPSLKSITLHETHGTTALHQEKILALKALREESVFFPANVPDAQAPYHLDLRVEDGRLIIELTDTNATHLPTLILSVKPYTRLVRDYFMLIESYEHFRKTGNPAQLEAVDMGRRGLHDEGATLLRDRLTGKIDLDHNTARRIFTLICVLHAQNFPLF